jgi:hypothetical protein
MIYTYLGNKELPDKLVEAIKPNFKDGPWIAGGAGRCLYQDEPINDIDIWTTGNKQTIDIIDRLREKLSADVSYQTDNAMTFDWWVGDNDRSKWKIQVITRRSFPSLQAVFNDFDFTCCQVATNGKGRFYMTEQVAEDLESRRLRIAKFNQEGFLERWAKYTMYGYTMPKEELRECLNQKDLVWSLGDGRSLY